MLPLVPIGSSQVVKTMLHHLSIVGPVWPPGLFPLAQAAVCFLVFPLRCVFAPLNPAFTVPEIEFEFQDLPCHTVVVMDGENNSATLQVGEVILNISVI